MFKHKPIIALLTGALALSSGLSAQAADTKAQAANRSAITTSYAALDRAFIRKDVNNFMTYIARDFVAQTKNHGDFDRAGYERVLRLMITSDVRVVSYSTKVTKWQWRGPDAIVWVDSKSQLKGPRGDMVSWDTTRHYWGKVNGKWQLRQAVTLSYKSQLNGKPYR